MVVEVEVGAKAVGGRLLFECDTIERPRQREACLGIRRSSLHRARVHERQDRIHENMQCDRCKILTPPLSLPMAQQTPLPPSCSSINLPNHRHEKQVIQPRCAPPFIINADDGKKTQPPSYSFPPVHLPSIPTHRHEKSMSSSSPRLERVQQFLEDIYLYGVDQELQQAL